MRSLSIRDSRFGILVVTVGMLALAPDVRATSYSWVGTANGSWQTAANWTPSGTPGSADTVTFNNTGVNGNETVFIGLTSATRANDTQKVTSIIVNNTGTTLFAGGTSATPTFNLIALTSGGGITVNGGAGAVTFGSTNGLQINVSTTSTITNNSSSILQFNNNIAGITTGNDTITFGGTGQINAVAAISNTTTESSGTPVVVITKTGTGTLVFGAVNSYTGATSIQNGTLQATAAGGFVPATNTVTLGSGANSGVLELGGGSTAVSQTLPSLNTSGTGTSNAVIGGASVNSTLTVNNSSSDTYTGVLGGAGTNQSNLGLTKNGAGALILSGNNILAGNITIAAAALGSTVGNVTFSGNNTLSGTTITVNSAGTLPANAANVTFSGTNTLSGAAINVNAGTLTFSGPNTISNTITLNTVTAGSALVGIAQASGSPFGGGAITTNASSVTLTGIAATTSASAGNVTFSGASNFIIDNTAGQSGSFSTTFAAGNAGRSNTGTLVVTPVTGSLGTGEIVTFTNGASLVNNGILPSYVTIQASGSNTAGDFASYNGSGLVSATTAGAYTSTDVTSPSNNNTSVVNQTTTPGSITTPVAAYALNTNQSINLGGQTLTLGNGAGQGGLILNGGSITNGTVAFGTAEGTIYTSGTGSIGAGITFQALTTYGPGTLGLTGNLTVINSNTFPAGTGTIANQMTTNPLTLGTLGSTNITLGGMDGQGKTLILAGNLGTTTIVNGVIQDPPGATAGSTGGTVSITSGGTTVLNALSTYTGGTTGSLSINQGGGTPDMGTWPSNFVPGTNLGAPGTATTTGVASGGIIEIGVSSNGTPATFTAGPFGVAPIYMNNGTNPILVPLGADRTIANTINMNSGFIASNIPGNPYNLIITGQMNWNGSHQLLSNIPAPQALFLNGNINLSATGVTTTNWTLGSQSGTGVIIVNGNVSFPAGVTPTGTSITINTGGIFTFNGGLTNLSNIVLGGSASGTVSINAPFTSPVATASISDAGAGTLNLNAQSTYAGGTTLTGSGTILGIMVSSNALPGASFTSGPFGTGTISVMNEHMRPIGGSQSISNAITMAAGLAMDNAPGDTTSSLTIAGPITMVASRFLSNQFTTGTTAPPFIIGAPSQPSTITMSTTASNALNLGALGGPIIINDVMQNAGAIAGVLGVNVQAGDVNPVTINSINTYTGATTLGGAAFASMGPILLGSNQPFGTVGTVTTNNSTSNPTIMPVGADRTLVNAITMTTGFVVATATLAQDPTGPHNMTLTGNMTVSTAQSLVNNLNAAETLTLGAAATPATLSLSVAAANLTLNSTGATTVVNDLISGAGALTVTGTGTVKLTNGSNGYSGATTVAGGTLLVNNTSGVSGTGTGAVNVTGSGALGSGGTLGGTGTLGGGLVTISSATAGSQGGIVYPGPGGSTPGTLNVPSMAWQPLGRYVFAYNATNTLIGNGVNSFISGTNTLSLSALGSSTPFDLNLLPATFAGAPTPQTYTIASFANGVGVTTGTDISSDFTFSGQFSGTPDAVVVSGLGGGSAQAIQLTFTPAIGTTYTWTGNTSGNWSVAGNWSPGVPPSSINTLLAFGATSNATMTNDISGGLLLNSMTFNAGSPAYTLGGNGLTFQTTTGGSLPQIVSNSANSVSLNVPITLTNTLTVSGSGNVTLGGAVSGAGGLTMSGSGTLALSTGNSYSGGTNVLSGTVSVATDSALGTGNVTGTSLGTLAFTGSTSTTKSFAMGGGTISVVSGQTVTFNGGPVSSATLDGGGTFATNGAIVVNSVATSSVAIASNSASDQFVHFTNNAALTFAGGLNPTVSTAISNLNGFTNEGGGAVTIGAGSAINAANFQTYGTLTLVPNTTAAPTVFTNTGTAPLGFNGGSRTFIGTSATADPTGQNILDYIDLHGQNAIVAGGLFVNNGGVFDTSMAGTATIIADFGSLVKGAGFYQNTVKTQNGGKFQTGNSPGSATFGNFVFGPGGVNNYVFAIDDATGAAGPSPGPSGLVSGWGLIKAVQASIAAGKTSGNFTWTATPSNPLTVAIDTLVNPTMSGTDVAGPMANFDPSKSYSWLAAQWTGSYSGPDSSAALDAATGFETNDILNPIAGTFGWNLDSADNTLSLVYTPTGVPEPGTLALTGLAGLAAGWIARRRRAKAAGTVAS